MTGRERQNTSKLDLQFELEFEPNPKRMNVLTSTTALITMVAISAAVGTALYSSSCRTPRLGQCRRTSFDDLAPDIILELYYRLDLRSILTLRRVRIMI